jgi:hypothetical protein
MRDPDEVSLQLDHNEERDLLGLCSDNDSDYDETLENFSKLSSLFSNSSCLDLVDEERFFF